MKCSRKTNKLKERIIGDNRKTPPYQLKGCTRIGDYEVPKSKIGGLYDMTYVTLDIVVHGEKEKC
ncbi:hypothetical protein TELCIR_24131 [Teladorsagia circumcincta]|uniref:Transthyretin-like family protein n=1 Tax=Teladorsagia circumcincta TaxID=45464 RepID=A0A2G9T9B6_TELCI|nr:hypothetical protein TELCIR_24131 [Teladorsagia circumcincta]